MGASGAHKNIHWLPKRAKEGPHEQRKTPPKSSGTQKLKRELKNGDRSDLRASLERAPERPRWLQKKWVGPKSDFKFTFSTPLGKHDFPPPAVGNMLPTAGRVRNPW